MKTAHTALMVVMVGLANRLPISGSLNYALVMPQETSTQGAAQEGLSNEQLNALFTLNQLAEQVNSFDSPQARARVQAEIASLLWPYSQIQARELFRRAFKAASEVPLDSQHSDTDPMQAAQQRVRAQREVLQLLAKHDPVLAEQLAEKVESDQERRNERERKLGQRVSAELLVGMALDVVEANPEQAVALGQRSLAQGEIAPSFGRLLRALRQRNVELASRLFHAALTVVRVQSSLDDLAFVLLYFYPFRPNGDLVSGVPVTDAVALLNTLLEAVTRIATSFRALRLGGKSLPPLSEPVLGLYRMATMSYRAAFEKNYMEKLPALQEALGEIAIYLTAEQRRAIETATRFTRSDSDDLSAKARAAEAESDPQLRDVRLRAVAIEFLNRFGSAQAAEARRLARQISNLALRAQTFDDIGMWVTLAALRRNDYGLAQQEAKEISNTALRGRVMAGIARRALADKGYGDAFATQLLDEALLMSQKADPTPDKAWALLVLAEAYAGFDVQRGFLVMGQAIETIDRADWTAIPPPVLGSAGIVYIVKIGGDGDPIFSSTDRPSLEALPIGSIFDRLAREDYWQTVLLANQPKNAEVRARMLLATARAVLSLNKRETAR